MLAHIIPPHAYPQHLLHHLTNLTNVAISDDDDVSGLFERSLAHSVNSLRWDPRLGVAVILDHAHGVLTVHVRRKGVAAYMCVCVCVCVRVRESCPLLRGYFQI